MISTQSCQWFWRIDKGEIWDLKCSVPSGIAPYFYPFYEVRDSKAPHIVIEKPFYGIRYPQPTTQSAGQHVLIPDDVLNLILVWEISYGYGGCTGLHQFLDMNYST